MKIRRRAAEIVPTREARLKLPSYLKRFREQGAKAEPVYFGARRRPEGVMLAYETYERFMDLIDDMAIAAQVSKRDRKYGKKRLDEKEFLREIGVDPADFEAL